MSGADGHVPVLAREVVDALQPRDGGRYVDGTFGGGGYTAAILDRADCQVIAIDRDPDAIAAGQALAERYAPRLRLIEGRFGDMAELLSAEGVDESTAWRSISASRRCSSTAPSAASPSATRVRSTCAWRRAGRRPPIW